MKSSELENLRLHKLSLENFRCFRKAEIDLSADVVAIYGRNGTGKTAIFDALEFALIGAIRRFEDENDPPGYVQNVFSEEGASARVDFNHGSLWVKVTGDQVFQAGVELDGSSKWVNRRDFVYEALANEDYFPPRRELSAFADLFRSTVLLSQDSIRHFVEGNATERSRVISYLAGSSYLQRCADKAKAVVKEAQRRNKDILTALAVLEQRALEMRRQIAEHEGIALEDPGTFLARSRGACDEIN